MKILFVSDVSIERVIGGAERVLYEQSTRMRKRGHTVHILTRMPSNSKKRYLIRDGVREFRYKTNKNNPILFLLNTWMRSSSLFAELESRTNYDYIICHQPFSSMRILFSSLIKTKRTIYTCHSLSFEEYISRNPKPKKALERLFYYINREFRRYIERSIIKKCDSVIVLSNYTKNKLVKNHGINESNICVIHGGVDIIRFFPPDSKDRIKDLLGYPHDRVILFTLRNLVPRMGLENLIKAVFMLKSRFPRFYLIIGGSGPLREHLMRLTEELGLNSYIRFEGFITDERLHLYYQGSDLFVLPSKELEGFGLVTLEALACGVPVLGTPIGGTKEILFQLNPDLLFKDTTPESIADKLLTYCRIINDNGDYWLEFCRRARIFVEKNYSWDKNIDKLEKLILSSECS